MSDNVKDGGNVQKDFGINVGNIATIKTLVSSSGVSMLDLHKVESRDVEIVVPDPWIVVLSFSNSWENFNAPDNLVKFMKHPDGRTEMKGLMGSGTLNTVAFTLPAEYAPAETIQVACGDFSPTHNATLEVRPNGDVVPVHGKEPWFDVAFLAADSRPMVMPTFPAYLKTELENPQAVFVIKTEYGENKRTPFIKPGSAVNHCDWAFVRKADGNYIQIKNLTGLPYNQKTKVRLMIVGA